jgi:hypothetical protein
VARGGRVEGEVEFQHVDSRFAENAELAALRMLRDEEANMCFRDAAFARDARDLILGR